MAFPIDGHGLLWTVMASRGVSMAIVIAAHNIAMEFVIIHHGNTMIANGNAMLYHGGFTAMEWRAVEIRGNDMACHEGP